MTCSRCGGPIHVGPAEDQRDPDATPRDGYSADDLDGLCWACLEAVARFGEPAVLPVPREPSAADRPLAAEDVRLRLMTVQNWICDGCGHGWWEADAYRCPACGASAMRRFGEGEGEGER